MGTYWSYIISHISFAFLGEQGLGLWSLKGHLGY